jgi:crotonobetainyl-CoA:carnitine CoA-transferase CaiB-like acyl-CoA transferase
VTSTYALDGIRIVDLSQGISGSYCTKLLADCGAEVVKIEPPMGDAARAYGPFPCDTPHPEKSALFLHLNGGKRSVTLDVASKNGREAVRRLVRTADMVVENCPPGTLDGLGLGYDALAELNARLVLTSITPFGPSGPYSGYQATHLINCALSGWMSACGLPGRPPLQSGGQISEYVAGMYGAIGGLGALLGSRAAGQGFHVEVSTQEALQIITIFSVTTYAASGVVRQRQTALAEQIIPCSDGLVGCHLMGADGWRALCEWVGKPELIDDPRYASANRTTLLRPVLEEFFQDWKREDVFHEAQRRRISFSLVPTIDQLLELDQHQARNFFVEVDHPSAGRLTHPGPAFRMPASPTGPVRPEPLLGQDNAAILQRELGFDAADLVEPAEEPDGGPVRPMPVPPSKAADPRSDRGTRPLPLAGVRVLDLTWVMAGPAATAQLAHMGAEVIKVESIQRLDIWRGSSIAGLVPAFWEKAYNFNALNRNKFGITLNLQDARGVAILQQLLAASDIVAENFTPRVMSSLGLDYPQLAKTRPDLIMISMPGYGLSGPWRDYLSFAFPTEEMAGIAQLNGYPDGGPLIAGSGAGDPLAGLHGAVALLAALEFRRRTGKGQHIDLSQLEASTNLIGEEILGYQLTGRLPQRLGNHHRLWAPHGVYQCEGEDRWVAIAVRSDDEWQELVRAMGDPEWCGDGRYATVADRLRHQQEIDAGIERWTRTQRPRAVMQALQERGLPAGAVLSPAEVLTDPHLRETGYFEWLERAGDGGSWYTREPIRLFGADTRARMPAPTMGEHNAELLQRLAGLSPDLIAELTAEHVLGTAPLLYRDR